MTKYNFSDTECDKTMIGDAERSKLQVGYKQAVRALNENKASKVFVAEDCDDHIKDGVSKIAMQNDTPVFFISTMKELGNMCKIRCKLCRRIKVVYYIS